MLGKIEGDVTSVSTWLSVGEQERGRYQGQPPASWPLQFGIIGVAGEVQGTPTAAHVHQAAGLGDLQHVVHSVLFGAHRADQGSVPWSMKRSRSPSRG